MKTDKIKEALTDLQHQRELIDNAINSLQTILLRLNGASTHQAAMDFTPEPAFMSKKLSYVEAAIRILEANERPMHVKRIWKQIQELRGNKTIKRQSVESTLLRHIDVKGDEARIRKVAPATYALPKREEKKEEKREVASLKTSSFA